MLHCHLHRAARARLEYVHPDVHALRRFDFPQITEKLQDSSFLRDNVHSTQEFEEFWLELKAASVDALKSSLTVLLSIFSKFIDMVIILFVTFYLLKDGDDIKVYLASLFPRRDYSRVLALFNRILSALRTYICSQLVICSLTAVVVFLYYTARSLPYASVFAMVSASASSCRCLARRSRRFSVSC